MKKTTVAELFEHQDDYMPHDDASLKRLWESFPRGVQASCMFTMNNSGDIRNHDILTNNPTKPIINTQTKWADNGTLYVFIQYWRVPPKPEVKREETAKTRSGFKADPISEQRLAKVKADEDAKLKEDADIAPGTHDPGAEVDAVDQSFDIESAELPPKSEESPDAKAD